MKRTPSCATRNNVTPETTPRAKGRAKSYAIRIALPCAAAVADGADGRGLQDHARMLQVTEGDMRNHGHELCLALACSHGDPYAIAQPEPFLSRVRRAVQRLRVASDFTDDVMQALRRRAIDRERYASGC